MTSAISDLQLRRLLAGVPQYILAAKLGIPAARISEIEHGKREVSPELEKRVRRAIDELAASKRVNRSAEA